MLLAGIGLVACGKDKATQPTVADVAPVSVALEQNCSTIALWNHDRSLAPSGVFGAVGVTRGGSRVGIDVRFRDAAGTDRTFDPGTYHVVAEVANAALASATIANGATPTLDVVGLAAGHTTLQIVLLRGTHEFYRTGDIPVLVGDTATAARQPFALIFNGVTVAASDGVEAVSTSCGRSVSPGRLEIGAGGTSEHYFFRKISPACGLVRMDGPLYRFTYELDDPCIAALLIGDHPESLLTFHLIGRQAGQTQVRFQFYRNDTLDFSTPRFPIRVNPTP
jgi:hypothetical protein